MNPAQMQIILHHYYCPQRFEPEAAGQRLDYIENQLRFLVNAGMLKKLDRPNSYGGTHDATDMLKCYVDFLACVPLPISRWVVEMPEGAS